MHAHQKPLIVRQPLRHSGNAGDVRVSFLFGSQRSHTDFTAERRPSNASGCHAASIPETPTIGRTEQILFQDRPNEPEKLSGMEAHRDVCT